MKAAYWVLLLSFCGDGAFAAANCGEPLGGHAFCASVAGGQKEVSFGLDCKFVFSGTDAKGQKSSITGTWDLQQNILKIISSAGEGDVTLKFSADQKSFSMVEFPGEDYTLCRP